VTIRTELVRGDLRMQSEATSMGRLKYGN